MLDLFFNKARPYLVPAGEGVFTVTSGADKKVLLHKKLYGSNEPKEVKQAWLKSLKKNSRIALLGYPCDTGGSITRGSNWGPLALRAELDYQRYPDLVDIGDIRIVPQLITDEDTTLETKQAVASALYGDDQYQEASQELRPVAPLSVINEVAKRFYEHAKSMKLLTLGGDHSVSYPLCHQWLLSRKSRYNNVGILHFDAHTDLLESRLGMKHCFATWAYHIAKELSDPSHLLQVGIRSSGYDQSHWEQTVGIKQLWAQEIRSKGINWLIDHCLEHWRRKKINEVYVSLDIDCLDSHFASATGTPEPYGLSPEHVVTLLKAHRDAGLSISGADLVEVAPPLMNSSFSQKNLPGPDETITWANVLLERLIEVMDHNHEANYKN